MLRILSFVLVLFPGLAFANDWDALNTPGTIAVMRHALAPGTGDPAEFRLNDCTTQRNLDARGQDQARAIGKAFAERGIVFDRVLTSQWCRTRETAELLDSGPVEDVPALNSFFQDFSTQDAQTASILSLLAEVEGTLMLVTHQVNITALTGRGTRSGEVILFRVVKGVPRIVGGIHIAP